MKSITELIEKNNIEYIKFNQRLEETKIIDLKLNDYLKESLKSDNKDLCKGWEYLKTNLTKELKQTLQSYDYWKKEYNADKIKVILSDYLIIHAEKYDLSKDYMKQLSSLVYVWNEIKRDCDTQEKEENLKRKLEEKGFIEITNEQKELNGKKVLCVFDVNAISFMGSFDKKAVIEGTLFYDDNYNSLMLIPKRCRKRGHIIKNKCYIKDLEE